VSGKASRFVTVGGPVGLALGVLFGALANSGAAPWLQAADPYVKPVGQIWMNALSVSVVPLTFCLLAVGVCTLPKGSALGKWGGRTMAWFVALLVAGALLSLAATKLYLSIAKPPGIEIPASEASMPETEDRGSWVDQFLPSNAFEAAANGSVLPIAVLAVLFGAALRAVSPERKKPVEDLLTGVRDAVLTFVHWVILAIPLGAFALMFSFAAESGLAAAETLLHFSLYVFGLLTVVLIGLVVAVVIAARRRATEVLSAVSPLVSVAIGTRSSLASLPSLVESARQLGLPDPASEIVLPSAVSVFKLNRAFTGVAKLLFMSAAVGIAVSPQAMAVFILTTILLSFATPGLPGGGSNISWGAYMAAGMPIQAIVLFDMTDGVTDTVKTAVNVVADFAVAVLVSRGITQTQTCTSSTALASSEGPAC
jgi:Na+/H+-dicarboxylate symporter